MLVLKGTLVKKAGEVVRPVLIEVANQLRQINNEIREHGYEIENFNVTFKGLRKLPEIHVNFKRKNA